MGTARGGALVLGVLLAGLVLVPVRGEDGRSGEEALSFPAAWSGTWSGELEVRSTAHKLRKVAARLEIRELAVKGRWRWAIRFGDQPVRDYLLIEEDAEAGRYVIDEQNSIRLPARLIGDELISAFGVSGNRLTVTYRREGDAIRLRMVIVAEKPAGTTGGEGGIREVSQLQVRSVQEAVLRRAEAGYR